MEEPEEPEEEEIHYNFTYDDYGNCITKSDGINTWEYTYDYENRLLSIKENGQVIEEYIYNGDGQRIKKISAESTRIYIYSGINILYEINMTTQMDGIYIYGPTGRIAKKVNDITEFYHTDHLGSTRLTTSETGSKVTEVQYKPFGEQINTTEEQYTYNGKELDSTGLYYYGARYYDPEIGRFISRDPLQGDRVTPQTLNRYAYCLNNPLTYIDPTGTEGIGAQQKVEDVFQPLQDVDPEELAEIQELLDSNQITELQALKMILELLGYEVTENADNTLSIVIGSDNWTVKVDNNLKVRGQDAYGEADGESHTISINFSLCTKIGDATLTVLHEVSHAVLGCKDETREHEYIFSIEYQYMVALYKLDVEFSQKFMEHIGRRSKASDPLGLHRIPIIEICKKWVRGWRTC